MAVTRTRVQRTVTRPRPPVAERVAPAGRRPPVPAPADLQRRLGNRGTTRLLARVAGETAAPVTPVRITPRPPAPNAAATTTVAEDGAAAPALPPAMVEGAAGVVGGAGATSGGAAVIALPGAGAAGMIAGAPAMIGGAAGPSGGGLALPGAGAAGMIAGATAAEAPPAPAARETPSASPARAPGAPEAAAGALAAPAGAGPSPEVAEPPAVPSAAEAVAPAAQAVAGRARQQRAHRPAEVPVANAGAAARQPAVEQVRSSAERTVEALDEVRPGEVPRPSFKEALQKAIDRTMPPPTTEDEAERVMSQGATDASDQLNAQLGVHREQAAGPLRSAAQAEAVPAPDAGRPAPELVPEPTGPAPDAVSPDPVVPAPLPAERLDYSSDRTSTDQAMADAGVSTEQLQRGNEPEFAPALEARSTAEAHEASAGPQYRDTEAAMRVESRAQAEARLDAGLTGMHAQRRDLIGQVGGEQASTRTRQSEERRQVTVRVNAIKDATRRDVEQILAVMDATAVLIFVAGLHEAERAYEAAFEEAKGGIGTWLTTWWGWDELIEESLATGRAAYLERVGWAIDQVATLVESQLAAAKQRVAQGRAQVETYLAGLDEGLRAAGEEARQKVSGDFDALEASVDERRDRLVERLTQQYRDSYQRMSETEQRLREESKSFWERVYDATIGVIDKIIEFKNLLLEVLAQAASVIMLIIEDPIGFLSNLVEAVTQGVTNFKDHIVDHLEKGLLDWVFGAVARAGIELPATFDLKGILGLVLQILGLTWQNIRRIAVEMVGEPVVHALEMFAEPIIVLVREGPSGLWEWIKEKLTDLKAMLLDEIQGWLITNVIEAGIAWILGLLTPASAFLKACKAIYDIVMFFVERAKQIADLVKAVTESVGAIARGSLGAAAQRVEDALARAIPVAIGLLASLLGLDDLSGTIERFIQRIREPIEQAIRWLIGKAVMLVKAAGKLLGIGRDEDAAEPLEEPGQGDTTAGRAINLFIERAQSRAPDSVEGIADVVDIVHRELITQGLRALKVEVVDGAPGQLRVLALASPWQEHTITFAELLGATDPIVLSDENAAARLADTGMTTWATLSVDGELIGRVAKSTTKSEEQPEQNSHHAEKHLIGAHWDEALARARASVASGRRPQVALGISRAPCSACARDLEECMKALKSDDPRLTERAHFVLTSPGLYEPTVNVSQEEQDAELHYWLSHADLRKIMGGSRRSPEEYVREELVIKSEYKRGTITTAGDLRRLSAHWDLRLLLLEGESVDEVLSNRHRSHRAEFLQGIADAKRAINAEAKSEVGGAAVK